MDMENSHSAIAHTADGRASQSLRGHLQGTAERAGEMAAVFGARGWGYLAGLWHDLGKYSDAFQNMIKSSVADSSNENKGGRVNHSTAGAIHACERFGVFGRVLAYAIAGHHAGLADWQTEASGAAGLAQRLQQTELLSGMNIPSSARVLLEQSLPSDRPPENADPALWVRMLFSCVVDADFLDTEAFLNPAYAQLRQEYPPVGELLPVFNRYMEEKQKHAPESSVNRIRTGILRQCIEKARCGNAIFTLTVPTGGGKTLSTMAFALNHAVRHGKRRVIYVIPYTSITEQTATQFQEIFGDAVVEHHCNLDASNESRETTRSRLTSENWDAPVIVTTSVQFFESLFSSRTSRCRKLHNIVNSVVILDEAQLLPPEFLNPILGVVKELQRSYGVTFVLSTATQPALRPDESFDFHFPGLPKTVEIVDDPMTLHRQLQRVEVVLPESLTIPTPWEELSRELAQHPSVLCIVNRRDDCRDLHRLMPPGTIHLSALMCGAHRSKVIADVKARLREGAAVRVISTQLVEAGVDLDFPVVYRAVAGLDSLTQAAGRCNREGSAAAGKMFVFVPPSKAPSGHLRQATEIGTRLLAEKGTDPLCPERCHVFFRDLYWTKGTDLDRYGIEDDLSSDRELRFSFRTAAGKFRMIDDRLYRSVIVRYGESDELAAMLTTRGPERWLLRRLQRYVVNVPERQHKQLLDSDSVREVAPGVFVQRDPVLYDEDLGLVVKAPAVAYAPEDLVC